MTTADIKVNGSSTNAVDVPINVLVALSNGSTGGETTFTWSILDQPEGSADALSNAAIANPTFTPKKEGTYFLRLVVNIGLGTEQIDYAAIAIRQLKSNIKIPGAAESIQEDAIKGWALAMNRDLQLLDKVYSDPNYIVCIADASGTPAVGDIIRFSGLGTIKTGLPGQETLMLARTALATAAANVAGQLGTVITTPSGGSPTAGAPVIVRRFGLVEVAEAGAPTVGDPVYVSDTAQPVLAPGSNSRVIGKVIASAAGSWQWLIG